MLRIVLLLGASLLMAQRNPPEPPSELLWPNGAPGAVGTEELDKPSFTPWLPAKGNGLAVVVCPGGGYGARSKRGETLMHIAAMSEKISIIQQLIKSGLNVRVTDNNGATPLHRARGAAVVAFLVTQGADVNARDNRGRTSLHEAVRMRAWDAVAALIKSGARKDVTDNVDSVDSADRGDKTPLDYFNEQLGGMAKPPRNRDELIKLLTP